MKTLWIMKRSRSCFWNLELDSLQSPRSGQRLVQNLSVGGLLPKLRYMTRSIGWEQSVSLQAKSLRQSVASQASYL